MWRWLHRALGCLGDLAWDGAEYCLRQARRAERRRQRAPDLPPWWLAVVIPPAFALWIGGIAEAIRWLAR